MKLHTFLLVLTLIIINTTKARTKYIADDIAADDITDAQTAKEKSTDQKEGDMKVTKVQELAEKGTIHLDIPLEDLTKWPSSVIPYVFAKKFDGQRAIKAAFAEYARKSCITFRPKQPYDEDYLYFYNGRGCWSFVGRIGGKQHVSLPHYCRTTLGTPVHEILHSLGFYHEQSRSDRDKYIKVEWGNIKARAKQNFEEHGSQDHGYPYDYDSVMHYSDHAFSRNGRVTLKVLKGKHHIGQRRGMSVIDAAQLNAHYCGGKNGGMRRKEIFSVTSCHPEEGDDCDDFKKEIFHVPVISTVERSTCDPESGEVCDDVDKCTELYREGNCYLCAVTKECSSTCFVEDLKPKCGSWANNDFCSKPNYRNWMSVNCATSCKGKCTEE